MKKIKSNTMKTHFQTLKNQREVFYNDPDVFCQTLWERPFPDKWSIGETLYHLLLMCRFFRRLSLFYIPVMWPVAKLRENKQYPTETYDIYKEFNQKQKKGMKAPFLIVPPKDIAGKYELTELQEMINKETDLLIRQVAGMEERIAGNIYYFDPIAHHPNLIQSIHLLAIHEQHHFNLTKNYINKGNRNLT